MAEKPHRSIGTLADWELATTNSPEVDSVPTSEHDYTLADLYVLLREIRDLFKPEHLEYIEGLITKHINDYQNPHRTDLAKMGSSVLQELYNLWLSEGNNGTREEFLKVLFQYVKIADILTTITGTARDQVPSVKGVATVVKLHDENPIAHDTIFAKFFPGEEMKYPPSYALDALIGLPRNAIVTRNSDMTYIDGRGILCVAPPDILPTDFTYGEAMFPLFGDLTNECLYSEDFSNAYWSKTNGTIELSPSIMTPRRNSFAQVFKESNTVNPVEHIIKPTAAVTVAANEVWAISAFVEPAGRPCVGIRIPNAIGGPYSYVHFDLETLEYFINDGADATLITARIKKLSSGMVRVCMLFKAKAAGTFVPELYPIDILSGDANYAGNGSLGIALFGFQVSKCTELPPYIQSGATKGTLTKTLVTIPLDSSWYDPAKGSFVFEVSNVISINIPTSKELYTVGNASQIALNGRFPAAHNNRFYFTAYNNLNTAFFTKWSDPCLRDNQILVHGYDTTKQIVGFFEGDPIETNVTQVSNPNCTNLYLGASRFGANQFNGWLRRMAYYPYKCTADNIHFLLGE